MASKKANKVSNIGSCGMQMRGGGGDVGSAFSLQSKLCSLSFPLSLSVVFFLPPLVSPEWESVCIHEDQLEGIPISTVGFFPSVVLFSAEGTVLFHFSGFASFFPLCVRVFLFRGSLTQWMLKKCHRVQHTLLYNTAKHLRLCLHVSVSLHDLISHCELMVLPDYSFCCV